MHVFVVKKYYAPFTKPLFSLYINHLSIITTLYKTKKIKSHSKQFRKLCIYLQRYSAEIFFFLK